MKTELEIIKEAIEIIEKYPNVKTIVYEQSCLIMKNAKIIKEWSISK